MKPSYRTCLISRKRYLKSELLRFVCFEGEIRFDPDQKKSGRGAYLLPDPEVIKGAAGKVKLWQSTFRIKGSYDSHDLNSELQKAINYLAIKEYEQN
jgi:predicted RNA-binding protein YlxR (DUF448 family)